MTVTRAAALAIRPLVATDWPAVQAIYEAGIATGNATLEAEAPDWESWDASHMASPRLVADLGGEVVGFCVLSSYSDRCVYEGVAWESVYVAPEARGRGVGRALLGAIIPLSERAGVWTLQAGVLAENAPSLALHDACGFRRVGLRERMGQDATGRWRDVYLLERRSEVAGG